MPDLPDELWMRILEIGTASSLLSHRDLCSLAIASRRLCHLAGDPSLWSTLLAHDFPQSQSQAGSHSPPVASKSLYKIKFERARAKQGLARRRAVLYSESQVAILRKKLEELESLMVGEGERMKKAVEEMANLEKARRASVALNVWQPEVVRGRQKQLVEQCTVPVESRLSTLKMEIRVCKQQMENYKKAHNNQKQKLSDSEELLKSLRYHPLHSFSQGGNIRDDSTKGKKLKRSTESKSVSMA